MTTTTPTPTHPAWCETAKCDYANSEVHWSPASELAIGDDTVMLELSQSSDDPTPLPWLTTSLNQALTVDDLETLGAWLTARASAYRLAISDGPSSPTVLDRDTGLTVSSTDTGSVVLAQDATDDGLHYLSPDAARALAAALMRHAAEVDAQGA